MIKQLDPVECEEAEEAQINDMLLGISYYLAKRADLASVSVSDIESILAAHCMCEALGEIMDIQRRDS